MTDLLRTGPARPDDTATPAPRAYSPPTLFPLGQIEAVTAGPGGGNLDTLFGGGGGFKSVDGTS